MTEAVFASEQVEELSLKQGRADLALLVAPFPWLPENFLVRYCPGDARNRKTQD